MSPGLEVFLTSVKTNRADLFLNCLSMGAARLRLYPVGAGSFAPFDRVLFRPRFKDLFGFPLPFMSYLLKSHSCMKAQTQDS